MNKYVIKGTTEEIDKLLIPNKLYDLTINKNTDGLKRIFFEDTALCINLVSFNTQLKNSNSLASQKKCSCFYKIPWTTKYANENNLKKTILLYDQQLEEYRYMIRYYYPSPQQSYMRYLSNIILTILYDLKRFLYNQDNNLDTDAIFHRYIKFFKNKYDFKVWVFNTQNILLRDKR